MASSSHNPQHPVPSRQLWFGFTGSAASWIVLSAGYVLITWWACVENTQLGGGTPRPGAVLLYSSAAVLLIGLAVAAGLISYRNWRRLSDAPTLGEAESPGRREFMALLGVFVSFTLGIGLIWLTIPLLILKLCVRAR
ncbi:MAG: hypothetical protein JO340_05635 [Acidobacteriaceae bacterium]|nr:hypothetical protein [Acidobacteriaceae bacterium]